MPPAFICTVSNRFPENYNIGVAAGRWGVQERYEQRIRRTSPGDLLLFSVGGRFRSLHTVDSRVFREDEELWPEKDGSIFPWRIRISEPLAYGDVPIAPLVPRISFLRNLDRWGGAFMGANGVFNDRMSAEDLELVKSQMTEARRRQAKLRIETTPAPRFPIHLFEKQIEEALLDLLDTLGCERELDISISPRRSRDAQQHFTLLGRKRLRGETVVLVLDGGAGSDSVLLHALRDISYVRQLGREKVQGMILTGRVSDELQLSAREIPSLSVRSFKLRLQLDPDPDNGFGRATVA